MTELRKDLFRLIDRVSETGETLRVRRKGRTIDLAPTSVVKTIKDMTPQERFDRWLAEPPSPGWEDCPDDLDTDSGYREWNADKKFGDL